MKLLKWLFGTQKPTLNKPVVGGLLPTLEEKPLTDDELFGDGGIMEKMHNARQGNAKYNENGLIDWDIRNWRRSNDC